MLSIRSVSIGFDDPRRPLEICRDFSLEVETGKFVAILGKSGCGKTTLLRAIAGLLPLRAGSIEIDGAPVAGNAGMVFQDAALFPWLSVEGNVAFGLRSRNLDRSAEEAIVGAHLRHTGLEEARRAYPAALSGGMKQRAAIARALAPDPEVVLMDEPFAALDKFTRASMQDFLLTLWEEGKKTVLFVTHDVEEAAYLADDVILIGGRPMAPTRVAVPFGRPRRQDLKRTPEFFAFRNALEDRLRDLDTTAAS